MHLAHRLHVDQEKVLGKKKSKKDPNLEKKNAGARRSLDGESRWVRLRDMAVHLQASKEGHRDLHGGRRAAISRSS